MYLRFIIGLFLLLSAKVAVGEHVVQQPTGSLSLVEGELPLTFKYSTTRPDPTNWVGLYHASGGGTDHDVFVQPSLVWSYAPSSGRNSRITRLRPTT
jgi:hypothetical protein